jgi:hypothetical protein
MDYIEILISIAIVIIILVFTIILTILAPAPVVFMEPYIDVSNINNKFDDIKKEIQTVNDMKPVIPIYGFDKIKDFRFPVIYNAIKKLPNVINIGIINLKPKFEQIRQYGYAPVANNTIRYFLPVEVAATNKSGIWIDGFKKFFNENKWICADISREHSLFNKYKYGTCTVLFIDILRESGMGTSKNDNIVLDEVLLMF